MAVKNYKIRIVKDNRRIAKQKLQEAVSAALEGIGEQVEANLTQYVPIDTGALMHSYMHVVHEQMGYVEIGSSLPYAPYVELGTGPNYEKPPKWLTNNAERGYHDFDPWWYVGDDGEWHLGWFIPAQPHLRPAIIGHAAEFKRIFKNNLENA